MNTHIQTSADSDIPEGAYISVCTELIPDALPQVENSSESENLDTGCPPTLCHYPRIFYHLDELFVSPIGMTIVPVLLFLGKRFVIST